MISIKNFNVVGDGITDDTKAIQEAVDFCADNNCVLEFEHKTYLSNRISISKNTIIDFNNATVMCPDIHFLHNFKPTDAFTKYNGNGNIKIMNLNIIGGHVASFIHGENIIIENVHAFNGNNDHFMEICACKNFVVKNCSFKGMKEQSENRRYVEYIQIDNCYSEWFPHFADKNSITYDKTTNENIVIDNCTFENGDKDYPALYTAIGSHGKKEEVHNNITIQNCTINGATFAAVHGEYWNNVKLLHNKLVNSNPPIFESCEHIEVKE